MQTIAQELEQKAQEYWHLSNVWNGKVSDYITVEDAIGRTNKLLSSTNPARPIHFFSRKLMKELIEGEGSKPSEGSQLLLFPDTADIAEASR